MNDNTTTNDTEIDEGVSTTEQPIEPDEIIDDDGVPANAPASRRTFLKGVGTAAGAAATGGFGLAYGTEEAEAIVPAVLAGAALVYAGYVIGQNKNDHDTGPDRDLSGYQGGDSLHQAQEEDVLELQGREEEVLTEVRNIIERGEVAATMDAKKAFIAAYNAGDTKSECQTAAETAVDDFWSNRQQSVVSRWEQAARLIHRRFTEIGANSNLSLPNVWEAYTNDAKDSTVSDLGASHFETVTDSEDRRAVFTCFNGLEVSYTYYKSYNTYDMIDPFGGGTISGTGEPSNPRQGSFEFTKYSDGATEIAIDTSKYRQIMDKIALARDRTIGNMATYVDKAFSGLERGEISTDDLLNHYDLQQEFSTNKEDTGYHGWLAWEFYSLGMEADIQHNAVLSFPETEDSLQLEGTLFVSSADPVGGTIETGVTYSPTQWGGESAFFTYDRVVTDEANIAEHEEIAQQYEDGSFTVIGKMQIKEKFTVEKLYNAKTGDEVDSTTTEKTNDQNYDPTELQNEIDRLNERITEMQENAEAEQSGGGGSGISTPDVEWWQAGGVGVALLGALYAMSSGKVGKKPPRGGR